MGYHRGHGHYSTEGELKAFDEGLSRLVQLQGGMMADIHEILTGLAIKLLMTDNSVPFLTTTDKAAIKTAADQIDAQLLSEITMHTHFLESQLQQQRERVEKVKLLYEVKFYRFNSRVEPMMRQETDVVFRSDLEVDDFKDYRSCLEIDDANEFEAIMWKEMWKQNPSWLLSHGPSTINFAGWSSVLVDYESLRRVVLKEREMPEDLTGEGNMLTALTFHPLLPSDMQLVLRKAYERGLEDNKKAALKELEAEDD